jgi:pimeloyl-ACP methyl ester carboxylesterase
MDEAGVETAALVGICSSAWVALLCAAQRPERVLGVAAISPMAPYFPQGAGGGTRLHRDVLPEDA